MNKWLQAEDELKQAQIARENHNEGMARVCARRAAGLALQGFLAENGKPASSGNAITLLNDPEIRYVTPPELHEIMNHLLLKVDENYQFPVEIDLLLETQNLIQKLKALSINKENNGNNPD